MSDTNLTKTVFFSVSPETVWAFLTEKDKLAQWFHPPESDLVEGEPYSLARQNDEGLKVRQIWGRVLTMDAPKKLVYTFIIDPFKDAESTVTWELTTAAGGTRLTLTHEGIAEATGSSAMQLLMALDKGWDQHLGDLRQSVA